MKTKTKVSTLNATQTIYNSLFRGVSHFTSLVLVIATLFIFTACDGGDGEEALTSPTTTDITPISNPAPDPSPAPAPSPAPDPAPDTNPPQPTGRVFDIAIISSDPSNRHRRLIARLTNTELASSFLSYTLNVEYSHPNREPLTERFIDYNSDNNEKSIGISFGTWNNSESFQFPMVKHSVSDIMFYAFFNPVSNDGAQLLIEGGFDIEIDGVRYNWINPSNGGRRIYQLSFGWEPGIDKYVLKEPGGRIIATWD